MKIVRQKDGSGVIFPQDGVDLQKLAEEYAEDGFTFRPGIIGVPITFLGSYCPEQFELIDFWNTGESGKRLGATMCKALSAGKYITWNGPTVDEKTKYFRILIRRK